jgi:hypothetical protein
MLADMSEMMRHSALAGCYHQWDKQRRDFLEREVGRGENDHNKKLIWGASVKDVVDLSVQFGWKVADEAFFPRIRAANLIVNVYKHGKGPALDKLAADYPQYVRNPLGDLMPSWADS